VLEQSIRISTNIVVSAASWEKCNYYKKKQWRPPSKKKKRGKNLSPRNSKACHNVSIALMQRVVEIGTQSTMKSNKKPLHEFTSHIRLNRRKGK
jgi:hypothetical protein